MRLTIDLNQMLNRRDLANALYSSLAYMCNMIIYASPKSDLGYLTVEDSVLGAITKTVQKLYDNSTESELHSLYDIFNSVKEDARRGAYREHYQLKKQIDAAQIAAGDISITKGFVADMETFTYSEKFLRYTKSKQQGTIAKLLNAGKSFQEIAAELDVTLVHVYVQHKYLKRSYRLWTYLYAKYEEYAHFFPEGKIARKCIDLFLEGCAKEEIAETLNLQLNNVRQHFWAIRQKLRREHGVDVAKLKAAANSQTDVQFKKALKKTKTAEKAL